MTQILRAIPLLVFPALLYAAVALTMAPGEVRGSLDQVFFNKSLSAAYGFEIRSELATKMRRISNPLR